MGELGTGGIDRFYAKVGARVREARQGARMTQAELASRLQVTRSSVANLEAGRQRIPLHLFALISDALDTEPGKLLPHNPIFGPRPSVEIVDQHLADADESTREFVQSALAQLENPVSEESP